MAIIKSIFWKNDCLNILDQTQLPEAKNEICLKTVQEVWFAIKKLMVRGAPAIGIAAGYGVLISAISNKDFTVKEFVKKVKEDINYLKTSRPTAVNLFLVLEQFEKLLINNIKNSTECLNKIKELAIAIHSDDEERCEKIGQHGQQVIPPNATIITHCNTGALATGGIGTALGVIYNAARAGKKINVYVDETRPLLQGARLTAYELQHAGINATLITDNMAAWVMKNKNVTAVLVGADRIAANGDSANKIGTYNLAITAKYHKIPFYIVAPLTTFDIKIKSGQEIIIEERDKVEITKIKSVQIAPKAIKTYNPAFDVTPNKLISGIITDYGIIENPELNKVSSFYHKYYHEPKQRS